MPKSEPNTEAPSVDRRHSIRPSTDRWGVPAPGLLRAVAALGWLSLVTRLLATALPGSESGIGRWIRRADTLASVAAQLAVLLGCTELVLLVVGTMASRGFGYAYRIAVVPAAAAVLMLVMLSSTMGLDPEESVVLAVACLLLALFAASVAIQRLPSRAQGLVLGAAGLAATAQFIARLFATRPALFDPAWIDRFAWLSTLGFVLDALAVALAATRLVSERRTPAIAALVVSMGLGSIIAWEALRGSLDHATMFQIIASRGLGEVTAGSDVLAAAGSRYAFVAFAVLLSGVIVLWPARISRGIVSIGLAILARPTVDVPACALLLALAALAAPMAALGASSLDPDPVSSRRLPRPEARADG